MKTTPKPRSSSYFGVQNCGSFGDKDTWLEPEEITYPSGSMIRRCRAMCEDGVLRVVLCGVPDTFFSIPARTKIKGKSVRGFVTYDDNVYKFNQYKPKN